MRIRQSLRLFARLSPRIPDERIENAQCTWRRRYTGRIRLRFVEIRIAPAVFLIPVLVTGIQPDQVLGPKEPFPRRRRGAALIPVQRRASYETRNGRGSDREGQSTCAKTVTFVRVRSTRQVSRPLRIP
ncbi:hypothetical protein CN070_11955 [Sinorhizobium meliloti]|nr:hypothetical protein CN070_11955 [Sinorhizobium meliloti]